MASVPVVVDTFAKPAAHATAGSAAAKSPNLRTGSIVQVSPPGPRLAFHIDPEAAPRNGGAGGWNVLARPRRVSALEWGGLDPYEWTIDLMFGVEMTKSVEADCLQLQRMARPVAEGFDPPILSLALHNYARSRVVIQKLVWSNDEYREKGDRVRATATVTFLEYHAADIVSTDGLIPPGGSYDPGGGTTPEGPVYSPGGGTRPDGVPITQPARPRQHVVKAGETITSIARLMDVDEAALIAANTEPGHTLVLHVGDVLAVPPSRGSSGTRPGQQR